MAIASFYFKLIEMVVPGSWDAKMKLHKKWELPLNGSDRI